jgi:hypothetical protein
MKQIQPVSIWINGQVLQATTLNAYVINDNLIDNATFYYGLYAASVEENTLGQLLSQGNLTMDQQDYIDWSNDDLDINNAAYNWIAEQLGLTII